MPKPETKTKIATKRVSKKEPTPTHEHFELLISDEYELTRPIPVEVTRYDDGTVVIASNELNLYGQGHTEYLARRMFSDVLVEELKDMEADGMEKLGRALQITLFMLRRLLKKIE